MAGSDQPLTGFEIFIRRTTEKPMAITINLGRKSTFPDPARTWVCRVSVRLRKPSNDGFAHDEAEIQQLGTLSNAMTDGLQAVDAEFVAMATSAGVRTWIFYAPADIGIDAIVQRAFAGQQDYQPVCVVESDPSWTVYFSFYPTADEKAAIRFSRMVKADITRHLAMTPAVVKQLKDEGDDFRARKIDYGFSFPTAESGNAFAELAGKQTFDVGDYGTA